MAACGKRRRDEDRHDEGTTTTHGTKPTTTRQPNSDHRESNPLGDERSREEPRPATRLRPGGMLQILPGVADRVDRPARVRALARHQRADVDDPLALLSGDAGPVVGVGRVWQVLVLA